MKLSLVSVYGQRFPRYKPIFKIAIFGHEIWPLAKAPEVADILSFYPRVSKLSLFLLYEHQFPRYGLIFKIAIFGHEIWPLDKVPDVARILSFYPRESKLNLLSLYGQQFLRYGPNFKIAIFGHETWQLLKLLIYNLKSPVSPKFHSVFALQSLVFQITGVFDFSIGYNGELEIFEKKNR